MTSSQSDLKARLRRRERMFAGWVSYSNPSITETFARAGFDFMVIDMEHSTINQEQAQRIIAASQSEGVPCIPRPVSHSNDHLKPLLESGADGALFPMVESDGAVGLLRRDFFYAPVGRRSYGVSRAQAYGFDNDAYFSGWNNRGVFMLQIESVEGVENVDAILANADVDGVMIGPMDLSGSLGVPGQTQHPTVLDASRRVIEACARAGVSCGTQLSDPDPAGVAELFAMGHTYAILGSDLFALTNWARSMATLMSDGRTGGLGAQRSQA